MSFSGVLKGAREIETTTPNGEEERAYEFTMLSTESFPGETYSFVASGDKAKYYLEHIGEYMTVYL